MLPMEFGGPGSSSWTQLPTVYSSTGRTNFRNPYLQFLNNTGRSGVTVPHGRPTLRRPPGVASGKTDPRLMVSTLNVLVISFFQLIIIDPLPIKTL